ncbi:MAG: hypothetical protein IJY92_01090 [Alphaproteobacteria bacterium]|nr:hypothetical protein [Alphaproteobacteria bacterium]
MKKKLPYLFFLFLMGCAAPSLREFQVNTLQNEVPIAVNVEEIVVTSKVEQFDRLPHIEREMPISPEVVLKTWANNRFYATGSKKIDRMHIEIEKAYMTKTDEKATNWYTFDNEAYKLTYYVQVNYISDGNVVYTQDVGGFESSSLPKRSSLSDKEEVFEKMMNHMVQKVNDKILIQMPNVVRSKGL